MDLCTSPSDYVGRWSKTIVVAGTGPGLTPEVANYCKHQFVIAVNDAHLLLPFAQVLYAADSAWWDFYKGVPDFLGERWSVLEDPSLRGSGNESLRARKLRIAAQYYIKLVEGANKVGFSTDASILHYGANSGFQAINLALHFGASRVLLIGFNMDGPHFFGNHPVPLRNSDPNAFLPYFKAASEVYTGVPIINCTPHSLLTCFPAMSLEEAIPLP